MLMRIILQDTGETLRIQQLIEAMTKKAQAVVEAEERAKRREMAQLERTSSMDAQTDSELSMPQKG